MLNIYHFILLPSSQEISIINLIKLISNKYYLKLN